MKQILTRLALTLPVVWLVVFGSSVMFSGTMRASKPA